jgi:hypothetical protein
VELYLVFLVVAFVPGLLAGLTRHFYGLGMLSFPAAVAVHGRMEMEVSRATRCGTGYFNGMNWVFCGSAGCFGVIRMCLA